MKKYLFLLVAMVVSLSAWAESHTATVEVSPEGYGTVQIGTGSNWSEIGPSAFITAEPGQIIVLRNTPSVGCSFVDYYGYCGGQPIAINMTLDGDNYYFNMPNADVTITAFFGGNPISYNINIDQNNFPDENFRNYLLAKDYGSDGLLTDAEIASITVLYLDYKSISDLTGIEHFTALKQLSCNGNQLQALDVSQNTALTLLACSENSLTSLDVSLNIALRDLGCSKNQLTSLDVSHNTALIHFTCHSNKINSENMEALVASLPTVAGPSGEFCVIDLDSETEQNVITTTQVTTARGKHWTVLGRTNGDWSEYDGSEPTTAPGDVNGDGAVTSADVTCVYNYLLNGDETFIDATDVNGDGAVTSADVTVIYNILLGSK